LLIFEDLYIVRPAHAVERFRCRAVSMARITVAVFPGTYTQVAWIVLISQLRRSASSGPEALLGVDPRSMRERARPGRRVRIRERARNRDAHCGPRTAPLKPRFRGLATEIRGVVPARRPSWILRSVSRSRRPLTRAVRDLWNVGTEGEILRKSPRGMGV
jgi:hypothetical protein